MLPDPASQRVLEVGVALSSAGVPSEYFGEQPVVRKAMQAAYAARAVIKDFLVGFIFSNFLGTGDSCDI